MASNDTPGSTNKRIEINDLLTEEKELTAAEAKKVKGGFDDPYQLDAKAPAPLKIAGHETNITIKQK